MKISLNVQNNKNSCHFNTFLGSIAYYSPKVWPGPYVYITLSHWHRQVAIYSYGEYSYDEYLISDEEKRLIMEAIRKWKSK